MEQYIDALNHTPNNIWIITLVTLVQFTRFAVTPSLEIFSLHVVQIGHVNYGIGLKNCPKLTFK